MVQKRDQKSFEWFLTLLNQMETEQAQEEHTVSEGKGKRRASSDNPLILPFVARARGQGKGRVSSNNALVILREGRE